MSGQLHAPVAPTTNSCKQNELHISFMCEIGLKYRVLWCREWIKANSPHSKWKNGGRQRVHDRRKWSRRVSGMSERKHLVFGRINMCSRVEIYMKHIASLSLLENPMRLCTLQRDRWLLVSLAVILA